MGERADDGDVGGGLCGDGGGDGLRVVVVVVVVGLRLRVEVGSSVGGKKRGDW